MRRVCGEQRRALGRKAASAPKYKRVHRGAAIFGQVWGDVPNFFGDLYNPFVVRHPKRDPNAKCVPRAAAVVWHLNRDVIWFFDLRYGKTIAAVFALTGELHAFLLQTDRKRA